MPPARRLVKALGSLQLVGYANNPTKVITELAFIADARRNHPEEASQSDIATPFEVQFDEFLDGVNSRGKGTKARQRKMTVEQAAAVLLVTVVQKGHVELVAKQNDPHTIDVIRVLPGARRVLASFLPKLRGYGDIPYDQQYRGAIALAKRHFFPKGQAPTKKELMALLLQSYQEKRELNRMQRQAQIQTTQTLGIQTSFIDRLSHPGIASLESVPSADSVARSRTVVTPDHNPSVEQPNNDVVSDVESNSVTFRADATDLANDSRDIFSGHEVETAQPATPLAPRSFNPYLTPVSNPRHTEHVHAEAVPSPLDASPVAINSHSEDPFNENEAVDEGTEELLQTTATTQGKLIYYFNKFCQKITLLEGQKTEVERQFNLTKKKLDETEQQLREVNCDRTRLNKLVNKLRDQVNTLFSPFAMLHKMANLDAIDDEESLRNEFESESNLKGPWT